MFLRCGKVKLDLSQPKIMGIVNVTPDSFSDGGKHLSHQAAIIHAYRLIEEGANILDIGGESTRPGAAIVSEQEELDRVIPVIEGLQNIYVPISIDTYKPAVMRAALAAGASMVNDINALQESEALVVLAKSDAAVCLMHKQGSPQNMQQSPQYIDVMDEVTTFLRLRLQACVAAGIALDRLVIDPGFGFGKTLEHNFEILRNLNEFIELGIPVLAGLSRKSMLGQVTGQAVEHRQAASVAAALIAVQRGARILRVHDVRETVDALKVWQAVNERILEK
ncbi:MAG: dihydropteroate synthase [Gallionellaceae bacterium]|nr:dihydropteroate synthase [Gallionellaceae bacterium]